MVILDLNSDSRTCPESPKLAKTATPKLSSDEEDLIQKARTAYKARVRYHRNISGPNMTMDILHKHLDSPEYLDVKMANEKMSQASYFCTFTCSPFTALSANGLPLGRATAKQQWNQWKQLLQATLNKVTWRYTLVFEFTKKSILHAHALINFNSPIKAHIFKQKIKKHAGNLQQVDECKDLAAAKKYFLKDQPEMIEEKLYPLLFNK